MSQALKTVEEIYEAMEQGNIGKIISVLDESFAVHLAKSLGGVYQGREGILDVVSKMCSASGKSKKIVENIIEFDNRIVALGNINFTDSDKSIAEIPFVDVWKADGDKIMEVQVFYLDAELLGDYLREADK
jgi:SnoaL-like domain